MEVRRRMRARRVTKVQIEPHDPTQQPGWFGGCVVSAPPPLYTELPRSHTFLSLRSAPCGKNQKREKEKNHKKTLFARASHYVFSPQRL
jgi:hypothetical protein